jgi:hypothetical protein
MKTCAAAATTRTAALGAALSVLVAAPAGAWQCDSLEPFLPADAATAMSRDFAAAEAVYLVSAAPGESHQVRTSCDLPVNPPPPPGVGWVFENGRQVRHVWTQAQYEADLRAAEAAEEACAPEAARIEVLRTLKGVKREGWSERRTLLDIVDAAPERLPDHGRLHLTAAADGYPCDGSYARRLSTSGRYLVFLKTLEWGADGKPSATGVKKIYFAEPQSQLMRRAEQLSVRWQLKHAPWWRRWWLRLRLLVRPT